MTQIGRKKIQSRIPPQKETINHPARTPTHQGAHHLQQGVPDTLDGTQNAQAPSRRCCQVCGGRSAALSTGDRLTRHQQCSNRRQFISLLQTRSSQQAIFEIRRLFPRSMEADELWPTYKRNAPQVLHPCQRHRCGRLNPPHPWPAANPVCSPPTSAIIVVWLLAFLNFMSSLPDKKKKHFGT